MTKITAVEAEQAGLDLCKLLGEGWAVRVWENLGIQWEVHKENVVVSEHLIGNERKYMVVIEPNYAWWCSGSFYDDPVDGIKTELSHRYAMVLKKLRILNKAHTAIWGDERL